MSGFDTIIVGSGISGLSAAVVLGRHGRRVLVLEAHNVPGGCMQMFARRGPDGPVRFDVGVHYVGSLAPGQTMWRLFRYLGVDVATRPLRADCFDRVSLPAGDFRVPVGWDAFRASLIRECPNEEPAITTFVARMRQIEASLNWHALDADAEGAYDRALYETSLESVLRQLGVSPRLRSLLCAQSSLYGVPADQVPIAVHAAVVGSAVEGPHYIDGGGDAITRPLIARIRELGGEVRTRAAVEVVLVEEEECVAGVRLAGGEEIRAPEVILALHPRQAAKLMPPDAWRSTLRSRLNDARECIGLFCVYGVVESDLGEYAGMNHYLLRDDNPDCFYDPQLEGPADAVVNFPPPLPRGPQLFTAMSSARAEWFSPWRDSVTAKRDAAYVVLKQRIAGNVMAMVESRLPGLRSSLRVIDASTPLTIRDYARYPGGGLYGLAPSLASQGRNGVRRSTRYRGLYVTGAGTGTPGILGASVTGFAVAGTILGTEKLIRAVRAATEPAQGMDSARGQSTIPQ